MIELRFVTLDLCEVSVIKIPRILEFIILKNDNTTSLITDSKVLSSFVIGDGSENIVLRNIFLITFSKSIDVHPVKTIGYSIWINLRFTALWLPQVLRW